MNPVRAGHCAILLIAAVALGGDAPPGAEGCAAVPRRGESIRIADESAIIVWDAASQTQHFIRRATFETASPDFGFLVPTPARPELAKADDAAFRALEDLIRPEVIHQSGGMQPVFCCVPSCSRHVDDAPPAGVRVLDTQTVAGFDTAVLEADDDRALADWLAANGYPSGPALTRWVAPYLAARWKITAFKIAQDPKTGRPVQASAVRMSFRTDRPYFPYREPEITDPQTGFRGSRLLRVFFVADGRTAGRLGGDPWLARVAWANAIPEEVRASLIGQLGVPPEHVRPGAWLTAFEDAAEARPGGDDVSFVPASDPSPVMPPPVVVRGRPLLIPVEVVLLGIVLGGWFVIRLRRNRRAAA